MKEFGGAMLGVDEEGATDEEAISRPERLRRGDAKALAAAIEALRSGLNQLGNFLARLDQDLYTAPADDGGSSIGGHLRHSLDHVSALLAGLSRGTVNYDRRERATEIESNREAAIAQIDRLQRVLSDFAKAASDRPLWVESVLDRSGPAVRTRSSAGRELVFVLSHTIHHDAMMAAAARRLGVSVPPEFGFAPSTLAFMDSAPCVPSPRSDP
jgi:uncharacterized damage-inducible protein DinB